MDELVAAYLLRFGPATRKAYTTDLRSWLAWCDAVPIDPLAVGLHHADAYLRTLAELGDPSTGRRLAPASIARRISAVSGFYTYAIRQRAVQESPFTGIARPQVSDESSTSGLSRDETHRLLAAAREDSPRSDALVALLVLNGLRISEALERTVTDLDFDRGHRILRIVRKGGKRSKAPVTAAAVRALEAYIGERTTGRIFLTSTGKPLDRTAAWRLLRRLAKLAGLDSAERISPHSARHTFATTALDAGVPLRDVQDAMGHADPRTTRLYDRTRHSLDRHATYAVASHLADEG